jgi:hypothetical protein
MTPDHVACGSDLPDSSCGGHRGCNGKAARFEDATDNLCHPRPGTNGVIYSVHSVFSVVFLFSVVFCFRWFFVFGGFLFSEVSSFRRSVLQSAAKVARILHPNPVLSGSLSKTDVCSCNIGTPAVLAVAVGQSLEKRSGDYALRGIVQDAPLMSKDGRYAGAPGGGAPVRGPLKPDRTKCHPGNAINIIATY